MSQPLDDEDDKNDVKKANIKRFLPTPTKRLQRFYPSNNPLL